MVVRARLMTQDGTVHEVPPGAILGRSPAAALHLPDPRISEAHALVSLREGGLHLLALRRRLSLGDQVLEEVLLEEGQIIGLAAGVAIEVVELVLPDSVPALEGDGLPRQLLPDVAALFAHDPPRLARGFSADADLLFWRVGGDVLVRARGGTDRVAAAGDTWRFGGREVRLVTLPLAALRSSSTQPGSDPRGLRITARWETVHITRGDDPLITFDGVAARLLSELARMRVPVHWTTLATEVWPDSAEWDVLRRRLDVALTRMRKKLREAGLPAAFVRTNGCGQVELMLGPDDQIVDET